LGAVLLDDPQTTTDYVLEMLYLTAFRVRHWADMLQPLSARLPVDASNADGNGRFLVVKPLIE
jgi:hypothetical protein